LQNKALESKFYQRAGGKISPKEFLDIVLYSVSESGYQSLNQSAIEYGVQQQITISKQGIDKRYTESAVEYLRLLVEEALSTQLSQLIDVAFLRDFTTLRIKDATRFDLPKQLSEQFKGFGGSCTSDAAICIQYEFDLKTLKFIYFNLTSANVPDAKEASLLQEEFSEGELVLRDLGYFNVSSFVKIEKQNAYYLSRLNGSVLAFENGKQICFNRLYNYMTQTRQMQIEMEVKIGKEHALRTKLVVELVPEEVYRKRLASLTKTAKRKGRTVSDNTRSRARFTLIITNIPNEKIPVSKHFCLYRLRWQIELMFKHWKSELGIANVQKMKYERFKCLIYAKLLYIILTMEIISIARQEFYRQKSKIMSINKSLKTILERKFVLRLFRDVYTTKLSDLIKSLIYILLNNHWQEKRKNRENFEDIFYLFNCNSNK
jgi:hypothetical protein